MENGLEMLGVVDVAPLDVAGAASAIAARDPGAPFAYVVTLNAQILILCADPQGPMIQAARTAWLRLNDSRVVARLQRWVNGQELPVAPGSDLCLRLLGEVLSADDPITVIGGDEALAAALRQRYGLTRLSLHTPPMG
ncbi:MAG: glycosyltransferase, partial [Roseococcus sp.]